MAERVTHTFYNGSDGEVCRAIVLWVVNGAAWLGDARLLQKLAANDARVACGRLKDADHVVGQVVGQDEAPPRVLRILGVLWCDSRETGRQ